jgi:hypothetical protein
MNNSITNPINDLLENIKYDYNLDFLKNIQLTKYSRKRQDAINRASKKSRDKKRKTYILMKEHIDKLHSLLNNNNNIIIKEYNEKLQKINDQ